MRIDLLIRIFTSVTLIYNFSLRFSTKQVFFESNFQRLVLRGEFHFFIWPPFFLSHTILWWLPKYFFLLFDAIIFLDLCMYKKTRK
jgi:hypothetical protein